MSVRRAVRNLFGTCDRFRGRRGRGRPGGGAGSSGELRPPARRCGDSGRTQEAGLTLASLAAGSSGPRPGVGDPCVRPRRGILIDYRPQREKMDSESSDSVFYFLITLRRKASFPAGTTRVYTFSRVCLCFLPSANDVHRCALETNGVPTLSQCECGRGRVWPCDRWKGALPGWVPPCTLHAVPRAPSGRDALAAGDPDLEYAD